jgi:hypothetical protein
VIVRIITVMIIMMHTLHTKTLDERTYLLSSPMFAAEEDAAGVRW